MIYHVTIGDRTVVVELDGDRVLVDGTAHEVDFARRGAGPVSGLIVDGTSRRLTAKRSDGGVWDLQIGAHTLRAEVVDERTRAIRAMTGNGAAALGPRPVRAPMPGMVVRVEVKEGDVVAAGQGVVIVEAMKMENELLVERAARVTRVHVREGEAVEKDQLLVDLAPLDEEEGS